MRSRLPSPALVVGSAALLFALGGSAFAIGQRAAAPQQRCTNGAVRALVAVQGIPGQGIENLPDRYTSVPRAYSRRFNCTGRAIQVRRAGSGQWDVRALGISGASCLASSLSPDAGSISCQPLPDGGYRVSLRGIATQDNTLPPMNVPFLVVIV